LTGIAIKINDIDVGSLSELTISTKTTIVATAPRTVELGDEVTLHIASFSGSTVPSFIRGIIQIKWL